MTIAHDVFISYSHQGDGALAPALEQGLEKLAKPLLKLRAIDVFRDETSISASSSLSYSIIEHLKGSRWFVFLGSPQAASSDWCRDEVAWWLAEKEDAIAHMLIVLTEGEIHWDRQAVDFQWARTTALPGLLTGKFKSEPKYVDLRWAKGRAGLSLGDQAFRDAVLDIAAPVRGVQKDLLDSEDLRLLRKNRRTVRGLQTAVSVAAVVASVLAAVAWIQRNEALRQASMAISRQLAAEAQYELGRRADRGIVRAVRAARTYRTYESEHALATAIGAAPDARHFLRGHTATISQVVFADDRRLLSIDVNGDVLFWDVKSGTPTGASPISGPARPTYVALSADGKRAARSHEDGTIAIWDVTTGQPRATVLKGHDSQPLALAFSSDGTRLVSGGLDNAVILWDVEKGEKIAGPFRGHTDAVFAVALSQDGEHIASGSGDNSVILWKLHGGRRVVQRLSGHTGTVLSLAFSDDGRQLASGSTDRAVRRWDVRSGKAIGEPLRLHGEGVSAARLQSGRRVAGVWWPRRHGDTLATGILSAGWQSADRTGRFDLRHRLQCRRKEPGCRYANRHRCRLERHQCALSIGPGELGTVQRHRPEPEPGRQTAGGGHE